MLAFILRRLAQALVVMGVVALVLDWALGTGCIFPLACGCVEWSVVLFPMPANFW